MLALSLLFTSLGVSVFVNASAKVGDCNSDGTVNSKDISLYKMYLNGNIQLESSVLDVNSDGLINTLDIDAMADLTFSATTGRDLRALCIPVLKTYDPTGSGSFKLTENTDILIVTDSAPSENMRDILSTVSEELNSVCNIKPDIYYGTQKSIQQAASTEDIVIFEGNTTVSEDKHKKEIVDQSYKVDISSNGINIIYKTDVGVFYAFTSLIQIIKAKGRLPNGVIIDYPDTAVRSAQIDIARKYYTPEFLKNYIRQLSWFKFNEITLHLSEMEGMRLESKTFPNIAGSRLLQSSIDSGITDPDGNKILTQEQMADIVKTAFKYQLDVVPSFDSPGHMNYLIGKYYDMTGINYGNHLEYNGEILNSSVKEYRIRAIDLSNDGAREFAWKFIDEFGKFFSDLGCKKFNIGGDEMFGWSKTTLGGDTFYITGRTGNSSYNSYWNANEHWARYARNVLGIKNGTAYDVFISYMNDTAKRLKDMGYTTVRCFSDEIYHPYASKVSTVELDKDIEICYWSNAYYFGDLSVFKNNNRTLMNSVEDNLYYVISDTNVFDQLHPALANGGETIFNSWSSSVFYDTAKNKNTDWVLSSSSQYNRGAVFYIWCDKPWAKTESTVYSEVFPLIHSIGTKMWNPDSNSSINYSDFKRLSDTLGERPKTVTNGTEIICINTSKTELELALGTNVNKYCISNGCEEYLSAYADANTVYNNAKVTQEQVDRAADDLENTLSALEYHSTEIKITFSDTDGNDISSSAIMIKNQNKYDISTVITAFLSKERYSVYAIYGDISGEADSDKEVTVICKKKN